MVQFQYFLKLSPSKERKQPSNLCIKQYNKIFFLCLVAAPHFFWPKRELMNLKHPTYFRFLWLCHVNVNILIRVGSAITFQQALTQPFPVVMDGGKGQISVMVHSISMYVSNYMVQLFLLLLLILSSTRVSNGEQLFFYLRVCSSNT